MERERLDDLRQSVTSRMSQFFPANSMAPANSISSQLGYGSYDKRAVARDAALENISKLMGSGAKSEDGQVSNEARREEFDLRFQRGYEPRADSTAWKPVSSIKGDAGPSAYDRASEILACAASEFSRYGSDTYAGLARKSMDEGSSHSQSRKLDYDYSIDGREIDSFEYRAQDFGQIDRFRGSYEYPDPKERHCYRNSPSPSFYCDKNRKFRRDTSDSRNGPDSTDKSGYYGSSRSPQHSPAMHQSEMENDEAYILQRQLEEARQLVDELDDTLKHLPCSVQSDRPESSHDSRRKIDRDSDYRRRRSPDRRSKDRRMSRSPSLRRRQRSRSPRPSPSKSPSKKRSKLNTPKDKMKVVKKDATSDKTAQIGSVSKDPLGSASSTSAVVPKKRVSKFDQPAEHAIPGNEAVIRMTLPTPKLIVNPKIGADQPQPPPPSIPPPFGSFGPGPPMMGPGMMPPPPPPFMGMPPPMGPGFYGPYPPPALAFGPRPPMRPYHPGRFYFNQPPPWQQQSQSNQQAPVSTQAAADLDSQSDANEDEESDNPRNMLAMIRKMHEDMIKEKNSE